jgi:hypothetical protein
MGRGCIVRSWPWWYSHAIPGRIAVQGDEQSHITRVIVFTPITGSDRLTRLQEDLSQWRIYMQPRTRTGHFVRISTLHNTCRAVSEAVMQAQHTLCTMPIQGGLA